GAAGDVDARGVESGEPAETGEYSVAENIAGGGRRADRSRTGIEEAILADEPAEHAERAAGDVAARRRARDGSQVGCDEPARDVQRARGIGISDIDVGCRARVFDQPFVLRDQAAGADTRLRSAVDGAAQHMNVADRAAVLAGDRAEEYEASVGRDGDVGEVEIAHGRAALDEREERDRRVGRTEEPL